MIHTDRRGEFVATCNDCGGEEYGGTETVFKAFVQYLKDQGWLIKKEDEEWQHYCPDCRGQNR